MVKVTYYRGTVEEIHDAIETIMVDSNDLSSPEVNKASNELISKYYAQKVYYKRGILLEPETKHSIDFGSYTCFIMLEKVD